MGIHLTQIAPGKESTEYHLHHYEEALYVLSGKGTLTMEGDQYLIAPAGGGHRNPHLPLRWQVESQSEPVDWQP